MLLAGGAGMGGCGAVKAGAGAAGAAVSGSVRTVAWDVSPAEVSKTEEASGETERSLLLLVEPDDGGGDCCRRVRVSNDEHGACAWSTGYTHLGTGVGPSVLSIFLPRTAGIETRPFRGWFLLLLLLPLLLRPPPSVVAGTRRRGGGGGAAFPGSRDWRGRGGCTRCCRTRQRRDGAHLERVPRRLLLQVLADLGRGCIGVQGAEDATLDWRRSVHGGRTRSQTPVVVVVVVVVVVYQFDRFKARRHTLLSGERSSSSSSRRGRRNRRTRGTREVEVVR